MSMKKGIKKFGRQIEIQIFALAGVMYLLLFSVIPMFGIVLAFKSYKITSGIQGIFSSDWVGLKYFKEFFWSWCHSFVSEYRRRTPCFKLVACYSNSRDKNNSSCVFNRRFNKTNICLCRPKNG